MNQSHLENNKFITGSLLILALVAIAFTLSFTKPIMIPFVMALLIRILIDPIIDFQTTNLRERVESTTLSGSALAIASVMGYNWQPVRGAGYWCYKGTRLLDLYQQGQD